MNKRIQTGPLPRLPESALADPVTLDRVLPGVLLVSLGALLAIQVVLRLL